MNNSSDMRLVAMKDILLYVIPIGSSVRETEVPCRTCRGHDIGIQPLSPRGADARRIL